VIEDGLERWDGHSEQVPCDGYAVLFGRSIAAVLPDDLDPDLALSVMDVCGAPALTARVVEQYAADGAGGPVVAVVGGAGKSGSLSLAAARRAGAGRTIGVVPHQAEADLLTGAGLADEVVVADARDPIALRDAVTKAGGPADITVVCVDVPGCEGGAILATADRGTVIFFSMATSFSAAALGAEGLAADVTMLVGNGYVPGHAAYALGVLRSHEGVRSLFERRLG
jgi:L-erythro-3,5-diaminohexanoate dehydrogenase